MSGLRLEVALDTAAIEAAQDQVAGWLAGQGADAKLAYRARLVIEELLTNLVMHGRFTGPPPPVRLALRMVAPGLELVIEDAAAPFDPRTEIAREPDAIGGLGLALVRQMAAIEAYGQSAQGWNRTRMLISGEPGQHA